MLPLAKIQDLIQMNTKLSLLQTSKCSFINAIILDPLILTSQKAKYLNPQTTTNN